VQAHFKKESCGFEKFKLQTYGFRQSLCVTKSSKTRQILEKLARLKEVAPFLLKKNEEIYLCTIASMAY